MEACARLQDFWEALAIGTDLMAETVGNRDFPSFQEVSSSLVEYLAKGIDIVSRMAGLDHSAVLGRLQQMWLPQEAAEENGNEPISPP